MYEFKSPELKKLLMDMAIYQRNVTDLRYEFDKSIENCKILLYGIQSLQMQEAMQSILIEIAMHLQDDLTKLKEKLLSDIENPFPWREVP